MTTLIPAYGRDYKTQEEVLDAWMGGNSFLQADGEYVSRFGTEENDFLVKFKKGREVTLLTRRGPGWSVETFKGLSDENPSAGTSDNKLRTPRLYPESV